MDDCQALEAHAQSTEIVQPAQRALDYPARLAQSAAMGLATARDGGGDAGGVQRLGVLVVVVAPIGLHELRIGQRAPALAADRRNGLDQRMQLGDVVAIGPGQDDRERDALRFCDEVVLRARASAIGGIRSCF